MRVVLCVAELRVGLALVLHAVRRAPRLPRCVFAGCKHDALRIVQRTCQLPAKRPRDVVSVDELVAAQDGLLLMLRLYSWFFQHRLQHP